MNSLLLKIVHANKRLSNADNANKETLVGLIVSEECIIFPYIPEEPVSYEEALEKVKNFSTPGTNPGDWDIIDDAQATELSLQSTNLLNIIFKTLCGKEFNDQSFWVRGKTHDDKNYACAIELPCGKKFAQDKKGKIFYLFALKNSFGW
ncbi:MAG: hypothetical protein LBL47_00160, partial [Lactobacillus sp.]|nr:hypothetical protein [Lactobacillus sp.]